MVEMFLIINIVVIIMLHIASILILIASLHDLCTSTICKIDQPVEFWHNLQYLWLANNADWIWSWIKRMMRFGSFMSCRFFRRLIVIKNFVFNLQSKTKADAKLPKFKIFKLNSKLRTPIFSHICRQNLKKRLRVLVAVFHWPKCLRRQTEGSHKVRLEHLIYVNLQWFEFEK